MVTRNHLTLLLPFASMPAMSRLNIEEGVSLARHSTMGVGGPAQCLVRVESEDQLSQALLFAKEKDLRPFVLGEGSNIVFSDEGLQAVVILMARPMDSTDIQISHLGSKVELSVPAWISLDDLIAFCVESGFAGLTCLSGIPGTVGAAPIQNVGAYGCEIKTAIQSVDVLDSASMHSERIEADNCHFGYRQSIFQILPEKVITKVTLRLPMQREEDIDHPQIVEKAGRHRVDLGTLRRTVLDIRRKKGMLADCFHSCGSFFKNPILTSHNFERLNQNLGKKCPSYPGEESSYKVPAAFLIERAGFRKGLLHKGVGLSPHHALSIIQNGRASSESILAFAAQIQKGVDQLFGILLEPEPLLLSKEGDRVSLNSYW